jgi:cytoskeletal protein CcmA (bactofilin family)
MFDKKNEKLESIIGNNTQITGNIAVKGTLRLDGRLTGNVEADWLIIGEKAFLKGDAKVAGVAVAGYLEGNVTAKEIIELKRTGQIRGDVSTSKLVVIEGGTVDGKISMQQKEGGKVVELTQESRNDSN